MTEPKRFYIAWHTPIGKRGTKELVCTRSPHPAQFIFKIGERVIETEGVELDGYYESRLEDKGTEYVEKATLPGRGWKMGDWRVAKIIGF